MLVPLKPHKQPTSRRTAIGALAGVGFCTFEPDRILNDVLLVLKYSVWRNFES